MQPIPARQGPVPLRRASAFAHTCCLLLLLALPIVATAAEPPLPAAFAGAAAGDGRLRVLVTLAAADTDSPDPLLRARSVAARTTELQADLPAAQVLAQFPSSETVLLAADSATVRQLLSDARVAAVQPDIPEPPALSGSAGSIGAPQLWRSGVDGSGQLLAVLDTGVERNHPFLAGQVAAELCFSTTYRDYRATSLCPGAADFAVGTGAAADCRNLSYCGHGTHVAGIIAGRPLTVTIAGKTQPLSGIAPGAQLVAVQVYSRIDDQSLCGGAPAPCALTFPSDQLRALQYLADNYAQYPIAAANLSLGAGRYSGACDDDVRKAPIDALRARGAAVIVAAGNSGYSDALSAPACISSAIAVGAAGAAGIASFSNRSAGLELFAPGTAIVSAYRGGYAAKDGTSMAAPHVAGAWALLQQIEPGADVGRTLQVLQRAAQPLERWGTLRVATLLTVLLPTPPQPSAVIDLDGGATLQWPLQTAPAVSTLAVEQLVAGTWQELALLPASATSYHLSSALPCRLPVDLRIVAGNASTPALRRPGAAVQLQRPALQIAADSTDPGAWFAAAACDAPAGGLLALAINGTSIGSVPVASDGTVRFVVQSDAAATDGWYELQRRDLRVSVGYRLSSATVTAAAAPADPALPLLHVPLSVIPRGLTILMPFVSR
jgi:subtilisin family serine protease